MNIAVLVKQTPQVSEVSVSDKAEWPEDEVVVNPFDEYAIEEALLIREKHDGKAIVISYGTEKNEKALRAALALGVDEAYLIADPDYTFLDPQKAAMVLAKAIEKIGDINMVLTGKQATDDDSALMAPSVAAYLDWPQTGFVKKFDSVADDKVVALRSTEGGHDKVEVPLPAVFSVVKEINEPRLPSLKGKMKAKKAKIEQWSPADLGVELKPMLEQKSMSAPAPRAAGEILEGEKDEVIDKLVAKLKEDQVI